MLKSLILLLLLPTTHAKELSCKRLFQGSTPLFERDTQVVAKFPVDTNGAAIAYARRGPIGPLTTIQLLLYRNSQAIIIQLDALIQRHDLHLFMNVIYKIYQMYMLPERQFRTFMAKTYGANTTFGNLNRQLDVLGPVLDHYGVVRELPASFSISPLNWITPKSLSKHYKKHVTKRQEFSHPSSTEYESAARDFWVQKNITTITLSPSEGHFIRYNYMTYEFSVVRDGGIITYFRLTEDYRPETEFDTYIAKDLLNMN